MSTVIESPLAAETRVVRALRRSGEALCVYRDRRLLFVNHSYARRLGYRAPFEVLSLGSLDRLVSGRDRDRAEWSQTPCQMQYDALCKDGRALRLSCCLTPVCWAGRPAVQQFVLNHGRCDKNGTVCRAEQRFRDYAESAADWFWETDAGQRFTFLEGGFETILGVPAERILGRTREQLYAELGFTPHAGAAYLAALRAHRPLRNVEVRWPHPDGGHRTLAVSGKPRFDRDGRFSGYRGVGTDITVVKRAERAVRESERFLKASLNALSAHIAIVADDGTITHVNAAWRRFARANGLCGDGVGDNYLHVCDAARGKDARLAHAVGCGMREVLARRRPSFYAEYTCHGPVSRRWFALRAMPFDGAGRAGYAIVAHEDISERKRAEAEAIRRQAELAHVTRLTAVGEMASGLAHELNQPLTAISNCCEAALDASAGLTDGGELGYLLEQIRHQTHRAAEVIRHLRPLVRKTDGDFQPVDLKKLIEETLRFIDLEGRQQGIDYRLRLAEQLPVLLAVEIHIEQVLINLCRNAIEAMAQVEGRRRALTVSARCDGPDAVRVSVADTGPGLSEPTSRLFTPYQTNKPGGLGMGLAISRRIVEAHGGRLWAEPADGGALFHFTLARDPRGR